MELHCDHEDIQLAESGMHLSRVLFAGSNLLAMQSVDKGPNHPGTDSGRMYFGGQWHDKPEGEWILDAGRDDAVLVRRRGQREVRVIGPEGIRSEFVLPKAGFPVALLEHSVLMAVDQDDGAEDRSDMHSSPRAFSR